MTDSLDPIAQLPLDPATLTLWRVHWALGSLPILLALAVLMIASPFSWLLAIALWLALGVLLGLAAWFLPAMQFARWRYALDESAFRIAHGLAFRRSVIVPRSRLQYVDLAQGPLERRLGLANLTLNTAGTSNATVTISGIALAEANRIRDDLLASTQRDVI